MTWSTSTVCTALSCHQHVIYSSKATGILIVSNQWMDKDTTLYENNIHGEWYRPHENATPKQILTLQEGVFRSLVQHDGSKRACTICSSKSAVTTILQTTLTLPSILVLQVASPVSSTLTWGTTLQLGVAQYNLVAVIYIHTAGGGHFTVSVLHNNNWFYYNDTSTPLVVPMSDPTTPPAGFFARMWYYAISPDSPACATVPGQHGLPCPTTLPVRYDGCQFGEEIDD